MMDSASSSSSVSAALMSCSTCAMTSAGTLILSRTLSSRSKILIAYQRCCSSGLSWTTASSICAIACSTGPENVCIGTVFVPFAARIAASAASMMPVPFSAEISTISQPSSRLSSAVLILSPFLRTTSIMLMAMTTGMPSSVSCVVKYRLRSRFVPSMMFRIASGRSVIR